MTYNKEDAVKDFVSITTQSMAERIFRFRNGVGFLKLNFTKQFEKRNLQAMFSRDNSLDVFRFYIGDLLDRISSFYVSLNFEALSNQELDEIVEYCFGRDITFDKSSSELCLTRADISTFLKKVQATRLYGFEKGLVIKPSEDPFFNRVDFLKDE